DVEDPVVVVVGIGAAVLILEAVLVLGDVRAEVVDVENPVLVVVGIGAAVLVLEVVLVLGIVGALFDVVGDAVAVAIERRVVGAAVLVLVPVLGLRVVRALVVDVEDAVLVVVRLRAAVLVLEVVEVLGIVGARVDVVLVAVAVAVADRGLEDEADEGARRRGGVG